MFNIGLALCGGGTKGVAHAGVIDFLNEKEIYPDVLSGTSAGAIVAAMYARGKTPQEIVDFFKSVYFFKWNHFTFTRGGGFLASENFKRYLFPIFDDMLLKDLPKQVFITATNMGSGKLEVFGPEVPVVDAIIASCAVPLIATPYKIGDDLYNDGGVLNNFPADVLKYAAKKIIGVYFSAQRTVDPSELRSLIDVTVRAYDLLTTQSEFGKSDICDWYINPKDLLRFNMFESKKTRLDEMFEIGKKEAEETYRDIFS